MPPLPEHQRKVEEGKTDVVKDLKPAEGKDELEDEQAWKVVQDVALLNLAINVSMDDGAGDLVICQK